jgi:pimeloyl-ACP methyl ester carboxylesterase
MDLLVSKGIAAYAVDFRGLGATARDASGWTTPTQSVEDTNDVIDFLAARGIVRPVLVGWSQGALIAQLFAQQYPSKISSLVLYGSIYNPNVTPTMESLVRYLNLNIGFYHVS